MDLVVTGFPRPTDKSKWAFKQESWGKMILQQESVADPNIITEALFLPDGVLQSIHCRHCSGRNEQLIPTPPYQSSALVELAEALTGPLMDSNAALDRFHDVHLHCQLSVEDWQVPEDLTDLGDAFRMMAEDKIRSGGQSLAMLMIVTTDLEAYVFDMNFGPDRIDAASSRLRSIEAATRIWGIREIMRRRRKEPLGAVFVSEGWSIERRRSDVRKGENAFTAADRRELLLEVQITADMSRSRNAVITRATGIVGDAVPGILGEWSGWNICPPSDMTYGVLL